MKEFNKKNKKTPPVNPSPQPLAKSHFPQIVVLTFILHPSFQLTVFIPFCKRLHAVHRLFSDVNVCILTTPFLYLKHAWVYPHRDMRAVFEVRAPLPAFVFCGLLYA